MIHSLLDDYFNFLEEKLYGFCFGIFFSSWQKNAKEKKKETIKIESNQELIVKKYKTKNIFKYICLSQKKTKKTYCLETT